MTAFEEIVNTAVALGIPREKAERSIRAQYPQLAPPAAEVAKDASIAEKKEQAEIIKQFRAYGCKVYSSSQYRPAKVSPGFPDLFVTHLERRLAFFWESKRQVGGELSTAQQEFRDECHAAGVGHGAGDRYGAATLLVGLGLAEKGDGPNRIVPAR